MSNDMNTISVGVIGGTPKDTELGVEYYESNGMVVYGEVIALTPQEQTILQYLSREELTDRVMKAVDRLKERNIDIVLIYCNSLSCSIGIGFLRAYAEIPIITPLDIYREIASQYSYSIFGILAANGNSVAGIERVLREVNKNAEAITYANLRVVQDIENRLPPLDIIRLHSVDKLIEIMASDGAEMIILGCTHYVYLYNDLSLSFQFSVPILDPSYLMLQKIVKQC